MAKLIVSEDGTASKPLVIISRQDAKALGESRFFTGKPCKHGHIAQRRVDNKCCVQCLRNSAAAWQAAHPEERRAADRRRYHLNPQHFKVKARSRYVANPEKAKANAKRRYKEKKEEIRLRNSLYRKANPELVKKWRDNFFIRHPGYIKRMHKERRKKFPEKFAAYYHKRRIREISNGGQFTSSDVTSILNLQKGKCAYCRKGLSKIGYHIDHITPLSKGGSNSKTNIQLTCPTCNLKKHAKDPIDFAQSLGFLL